MLTFKQGPLPFTTTEALEELPKGTVGTAKWQQDQRKWVQDISRRFKEVHERVKQKLTSARMTQKK